jgi:redox-sensitive bicupin YhaK (pirin superfamily)
MAFFSHVEGREPPMREPFTNHSLVLFDDGDGIRMMTGNTEARLLMLSGKPINESIAWYGPMVMNTQEEIDLALSEYRKGTFIKHE